MEKSWHPLLIFCLCGVFGILPDIDHAIQFESIPKETSARFLHGPILIIISTIILYLLAYIVKLYWESLLTKEK